MPFSSPRKSAETIILSAERHVAHGEALLQRGRPEAALATADAVLAQTQAPASAWLLRGSACRALHRFSDAAEAFRAVLNLYPDFNQMRLNIANALIELGDLADAEAQLHEAVARDPDFAAAHASLSSLYMRMDRHDLAEAPARAALIRDPALAVAHQNLAAILALRGDPQADAHRDAVYRRQQIFVEPTPGAERTVLILTASGSGNIPYQHLLPRGRYNRILWHIAYAPPGQERSVPTHDLYSTRLPIPMPPPRRKAPPNDLQRHAHSR